MPTGGCRSAQTFRIGDRYRVGRSAHNHVDGPSGFRTTFDATVKNLMSGEQDVGILAGFIHLQLVMAITDIRNDVRAKVANHYLGFVIGSRGAKSHKSLKG